MRNSLALLGIPDLPIYAFRHVGDRRIQPQGGGGGIPIVSDVIDAGGDLVSSVSDAVADVDDTVNEEIPGGWVTVASIAVPVAAPYIQAANVLDRGGSLEDAAKAAVIGQVAGQVGAGVGAEAGSFAGNVAGGTTGGLLSGKSLEESVKGGVISGGVSQVTPSSLFTPSATTATQDYVPELNIGQGTPSTTSDYTYLPSANVTPTSTGQGTTGANNMATDFEYFDTGESVSGVYGDQESVSGQYGYLDAPQDSSYGYGFGTEATPTSGFGSTPYTQAQIDAMTAQTYGGNNYLSSLDAATQAIIKRALAAGGSAAQGAMNFLGQKGVVQGGLGTAANLMQLQADRQAAQQAQARIGQATQQAVAGSQFRPVGTTTRFGTSNFQVDPATGQLVSAGYTAAPEITSAQNRLLGLGASYLAQTPEEVAQQYMTRQYDLLDPSRQRQLAGIRNENFRTGRGGLSVGSTGLRPSGAQGLMGANPELEAYYNALAQQDAQLAAQAQQAGQQQVTFGTGLFGQAGTLENMAQQPFNLSQGLAEKSSVGGYRSGSLGIQGNVYGNAIGLSAANTTNPFATVLGGLSSPTSLLSQGIGSYFSSPFGGTPQGGGAQLGQYMAGVTANPLTEQARMLAEQENAFRGSDNYVFDPMYAGGQGGYA
jgi:hypothetical protein